MRYPTESLWLLSLVTITFHTSATLAYALDGSCSKYSPLISDSVTAAFGMAQVALDDLTQRRQDQDLLRLIRLLFCAPGDNPATKDLSEVIKSFQGITSMSMETATAADEPTDVVFYCNMNHLKKRSDGRWWNPASWSIFPNNANEHADGCSHMPNDYTTAFGWYPGWNSGQSKIGMSSQVVVCPWFFEWAAQKANYTTWKAISLKAKLAVVMQPKITKWKYTPIDGLQLLDKVLLHELTHTFSGGTSKDHVIPVDGTVDNKAYGWKAALSLARQNIPNKSPMTNADTLALFGSAVRMLRSDSIRYIADDGSVSMQAIRKRNSMFGNGTNPEFEALIEMLKTEHALIGDEPYYQDA